MLKAYRFSIILCVIVAVLSLMPLQTLPKASLLSDKLIHFLMYFGISCVIVYEQEANRKESKFVIISTILFCTLYGFLLELGQRYSPGRNFDWWDALYNALGGLTGSVFSRFILNRIKL